VLKRNGPNYVRLELRKGRSYKKMGKTRYASKTMPMSKKRRFYGRIGDDEGFDAPTFLVPSLSTGVG
jgi:hypothetical protein